jgi:hypothetical protein
MQRKSMRKHAAEHKAQAKSIEDDLERCQAFFNQIEAKMQAGLSGLFLQLVSLYFYVWVLTQLSAR